MDDALEDSIRRFGRSPRWLLRDRFSYLRIPRPPFLQHFPSDKIGLVFQHSRRVFTRGTVVWGRIIQANSLMFEDGVDDCPGELVYSLEDADVADTSHLQYVAEKLYALKGTTPKDVESARVADYLTKETVRVFGLPVPKSISPRVRCRISTTFFVRKHLPNRRLSGLILPVVVNPQPPHVALPLPAKYWCPDLVRQWTQ